VYKFTFLVIAILVLQPSIPLFEKMNDSYDEVDNAMAAADVVITSDDDWVLQGWPGNGTIGAPFIINGLFEQSIDISNTTKWFTIQNSTFYSLILNNVTNGKIERSVFLDLQAYGSINISILNNMEDTSCIILDSCSNILVSNTSFLEQFNIYEESVGVSIRNSRDVRITNNSLRVYHTGIGIVNSSECILERNHITECGMTYYTTPTTVTVMIPSYENEYVSSQSQYGILEGQAIEISNCSETDIHNNSIVQNGGRSIVIAYSVNTTVFDNDISLNNGGILIQSCSLFNITANSINNGVFVDYSTSGIIADNQLQSSGISLQGNLSCLLHSISNNTVGDLPIVYLSEANSEVLDCGRIYQFIIVSCTEIFLHDTEVDGGDGVDVLYSESCEFHRISSQRFNVRSGSDILLQDSNIDYVSGYGVIVDSSQWIRISSSSLTCGILVTNNSRDIPISNNVFRNTRSSAISVERTASNVFIEGNDIRQCGMSQLIYWYSTYYRAIDIQGRNCFITDNVIVDNYGRGIAVYGENVSVYYNIIARNGGGNAADYGSSNAWDDNASRGNLWGDYIGFGYYYIPGDAGGVDRYPALATEYMELSVPTTWALMLGTPIVFFILLGIVIRSRRSQKNRFQQSNERGRIGFG
jgi:hypothetical protein